MSIADEEKGLWQWGGGLNNDCEDFSVSKKQNKNLSGAFIRYYQILISNLLYQK